MVYLKKNACFHGKIQIDFEITDICDVHVLKKYNVISINCLLSLNYFANGQNNRPN